MKLHRRNSPRNITTMKLRGEQNPIKLAIVTFLFVTPSSTQLALAQARVSGGVMSGAILTRVQPVYPPIAKAAHVAGTVTLHAIISKTGNVKNLKVLSGPPMLQDAAIDAVKQWTYKPYRLNGVPTEVDTTVSVNFNFSDGSPAAPPPPAPATAQTTGTTQTQSGATLDETMQWLQGKIESYAGGLQQEVDTGWTVKDAEYLPHGDVVERYTNRTERSNVRTSYGPAACVLTVSWHRKYSWTHEEKRESSAVAENEFQDKDVTMQLPLYDLKAAAVTRNSYYAGNVVTLTFQGKKAIDTQSGTDRRSIENPLGRYCSSNSERGVPSCWATPTKEPGWAGDFPIQTTTAEAVEWIPFQRDKAQDNDELMSRVANAFNHARDLCAAQKPKSNEPF